VQPSEESDAPMQGEFQFGLVQISAIEAETGLAAAPQPVAQGVKLWRKK